ncbi:MAG TPA: methyltransferase domain-containing protein [Acidimicrobiales bacterium]|nr:methyltransferase domain-containing protein [Acidimicrobiales bacterium]
MCNPNCLRFVNESLSASDVGGRRVLEVGAYDVNGSPRAVIEAMGPASYLGVDIMDGPGVDEVCSVEGLLDRFGPEAFDVVVSTEMIEHVADWQGAVSNLKRVTAPEGVIVLTTRSKGFPLHDYPADYWRFEQEDMRVVFSDCAVEELESDAPEDPGVFVKARKPGDFRELDLAGYALFSMVSGGRALTAADAQRAVADAQQAVADAQRAVADAARLQELEARVSQLQEQTGDLRESNRLLASEAASVGAQLHAMEQLRVLRYSAPLRRLYGSTRAALQSRSKEPGTA